MAPSAARFFNSLLSVVHCFCQVCTLTPTPRFPLTPIPFDDADSELLSDIIGRLGLADVAEFGLRWQDCEEFLRRLGYRATVTVSKPT